MQILKSAFKALCGIHLPAYRERQVRYHTFDLASITMPDGCDDYMGPVAALCKAAGAVEGEAYLTIDESLVKAGMSQRRPGPHVDGCFRKEQQSWGGGGWKHYCNDVGATAIGRMPVIVAASVPGCKAWKGMFKGRPAKDGDLSHISDQLGKGEILPANMGYLLSPDCVHESMRFERDTLRTFIRIALPADFGNACEWD